MKIMLFKWYLLICYKCKNVGILLNVFLLSKCNKMSIHSHLHYALLLCSDKNIIIQV